jgi:hypothetical protein
MPVKAIGGLRINIASVQDQTTEGGLYVRARTAEPIVKIEMAESRVEVVAPEQPDHTTPEPDTFWIAGWSIERTLRFREFIDLLRLLARFLGRRRSFVSGLGVVGLGVRRQGKRVYGGGKEPEHDAQSAGKAERTIEHGRL